MDLAAPQDIAAKDAALEQNENGTMDAGVKVDEETSVVIGKDVEMEGKVGEEGVTEKKEDAEPFLVTIGSNLKRENVWDDAKYHINSNTSNHVDEDGNECETKDAEEEEFDPRGKLVPPLNFAIVQPGIYRSGFPNPRNFSFLKTLKLKSIIYFCSDDYLPENETFVRGNGIEFIHIRSQGNKEPFVQIDDKDINTCLRHLLDTRNHPVLVHCNRGCHRVGCLVGCLRKVQQWSMPSIFEEYRRFSNQVIKVADQESIEMFVYDNNNNNNT